MPTTAVSAGPLRVLIVDDAASTRLLLRRVLESSPSFTVADEAADGEAALLAIGEDVDLVLLDLDLPDGDGARLLPELRRRAPAAAVIVLSNNARSAADDLTGAGATGWLEKGLPPKKLIDAIAGILGITAAAPADDEDRLPVRASTPVATPTPTVLVVEAEAIRRRQLAWLAGRCGAELVIEVTASGGRVADAVASALAMTEVSAVLAGGGADTPAVVAALAGASVIACRDSDLDLERIEPKLVEALQTRAAPGAR